MPENIAYAAPSAPSDDPAHDEPGRRECLRCYLVRMVRAHGCDNSKQWTLRWRDRRAPGDGQLIEQLEERGGICCDCEVVFNVWQHEEGDWRQEEVQDWIEGAWLEDAERDSPGAGGSPLLACAGASGGDPLVPCARWHGWSVSDPYDPADDLDYDEGDEGDEVYEEEP
jgi:hypothetical protein